jgi:hypothetical protein
VRWAAPMKTVNVPDGRNGRRRVGVREVKWEMSCVVIGKGKEKSSELEGLLMNVMYKGTCKGVWFPGVATMLGLGVGLEAKGSDVSWVPGVEPKWTVNGRQGYTGYDIGSPPLSLSTRPSLDSPCLLGLQPSGLGHHDSGASSMSSLLRAPLPAQNVADYSCEGVVPSAKLRTVDSMYCGQG